MRDARHARVPTRTIGLLSLIDYNLDRVTPGDACRHLLPFTVAFLCRRRCLCPSGREDGEDRSTINEIAR